MEVLWEIWKWNQLKSWFQHQKELYGVKHGNYFSDNAFKAIAETFKLNPYGDELTRVFLKMTIFELA